MVQQSREPRAVLRETPEVSLVESPHQVEGRRVHVVGRPADRRQTAGEIHLAQAVRRGGQVLQGTEAPERLTEKAPATKTEVLAQALGVADDRVRAEVAQPLGLGDGIRARSPIGGRSSGATLVEHDHPVVAQRASEPGRRARKAGRTRRLVSRAALQEEEVRLVTCLGCSDLAREHLDRRPVRPVMIERNGERVLDQHHRRTPPGRNDAAEIQATRVWRPRRWPRREAQRAMLLCLRDVCNVPSGADDHSNRRGR